MKQIVLLFSTDIFLFIKTDKKLWTLILKKSFIFLTIFFYPNPDSSKDTYKFLEQANVNSERISIKYLLFVVGGFFVNTTTMSGVSVLVCRMLKGNFDPKYVYHPFQVL